MKDYRFGINQKLKDEYRLSLERVVEDKYYHDYNEIKQDSPTGCIHLPRFTNLDRSKEISYQNVLNIRTKRNVNRQTDIITEEIEI